MSSTYSEQTASEIPESILNRLASVLPIVDFTELAENVRQRHGSPIGPASPKHPEDAILRALYQQPRRHVLVTGFKGVGKTSLVQSIALKATLSEIPYLSGERFLWIDCQNVGPEDSRACLESIFAAIASQTGIVLCLDGIGALLKRAHGGTNKPLLRAMVARPGIRLIGVMSSWEYNDLVGGDAQMLERFTRVEICEPLESTASEIAMFHAQQMAAEFRLYIDDHVVTRTVALASTFILNECHPAKSITILRQAFSNADYERTQLGLLREEVTVSDVIGVISEKTGMPPETIAGENQGADFKAALRDAVTGQEEAIEQTANELQLIKAGLNEPGKPAAVLLFAGMTGVGKTELAKRIAELYSTSRRLQVYTMGNFTEPHSVSGIIGVPPGYVGHDEGGRLINELNADPYSVFLLDEAEKCHPNIWKPFLNLFDEGWIVDQRGVKAYADRAIFILTTNAGDKNIAQMVKNGQSSAEITERVKQVLSKVRLERSTQPVFTPQFLSRIKRIIAFAPLDEPAMIGITERRIRKMQQLWKQKREKQIDVSRGVVERIGGQAHQLNEQSGGQEGGRIVGKLVSDLIERKIQETAQTDPEGYKNTKLIRVDCQTIESGIDSATLLVVQVKFQAIE